MTPLLSLHFRDSVSTWTHGLWLLFLMPLVLVLLRLSRQDRIKQLGFAVYGVCMWVCFLNSALFHGCDPEWVDSFNLLDHVGIFLMIAGTVTPIALTVLKGRWRLTLLAGIWAFALVGVGTRVWLDLPLWMRTGYYILMGWVGCVTYFQLARRLGHRKVAPMWIGGLFYTVGATLNVIGWPDLLPGYFGPHELFHVCVMAGSLAHFYFMLVVLVPCWRVPFFVCKPARTSPDFPVSPGVEFADSGVRS